MAPNALAVLTLLLSEANRLNVDLAAPRDLVSSNSHGKVAISLCQPVPSQVKDAEDASQASPIRPILSARKR